MCGIAGAFDLTGRREFPEERLLRMTGAMASRAQRRAFPSRTGPRSGRSPPVGDRRGQRPAAAVQRRPATSGWPTRASFTTIRRSASTCSRRPSAADALRHRSMGPSLRRPGRKGVRSGVRTIRRLVVGPQRGAMLVPGRDRIGISPLFYAESDGWLLWASEIKSLLASGLIDARPDVARHRLFLQLLLSALTTHAFRGHPLGSPPGH